MSATLPGAIKDALVARFASLNAGLPSGSVDTVSVYLDGIPGSPTSRYALVECSPFALSSSGWDGAATDGDVEFWVTFAATSGDVERASLRAHWLANEGVKTLVDASLSVDGFAGSIFPRCQWTGKPDPNEVVADRVTVSVAALFAVSASRTT